MYLQTDRIFSFDSLYFFQFQKHPDSAMTHSTENVICTMLASCSVVIDPLVYIINHKKYRRAMIQMFHPKQPDDDDIQGRQRKSSWASSVLSSRVSSVSSVFTRRESSAVQMNPWTNTRFVWRVVTNLIDGRNSNQTIFRVR